MLSYALAIAVALSSFVLFLTAFLMSDIHRKDDFLWSGVGLFYALILWFCARNITGAVLLGQASASILLVSFVWQTLKLRKAIAHPERAVEISNFSVLQAVNGLVKGRKQKSQVTPPPSVKESPDVVTESEIAIPQTASTEAKSPIGDSKSSQPKAAKGGAFSKFFGNKKKATVPNAKLNDILDKEEVKTAIPATTQSTPPQTFTQSDRQPQPEAVIKVAEDKPEIKDSKPPEIVDTSEKIVVKEEAKAPTPEIIQPEESNLKPEIETVENEVVEQKIADALIEAPVETDRTLTIGTETVDSSIDIIDNSEQKTEIVEATTNRELEVATPETTEEIEVIEPKTNPSALDSLETVEVAEVLDELPENSSEDKNGDRSNIIEVTSTDVDNPIQSDRPNKDTPSDSKPD